MPMALQARLPCREATLGHRSPAPPASRPRPRLFQAPKALAAGRPAAARNTFLCRAAKEPSDPIGQPAEDLKRAAEPLADVAQEVAGEVLYTAAELAGAAASDAADVAAAAQQAAADVQQQAAGRVAEAARAVADAAATASAASSPASAAASSAAASSAAAASAAAPPASPASPPSPPGQPAASPSAAAAAPAASGGAPGSGASGSGAPGAVHSSGSAAADRADEIRAVKQQLVSLLASLDRGAAATEDQAQRVDNMARRLEALGGAVALTWERPASGAKPGLALLDGRWRLLYSSGFTSGSLGGRRPGPALGALPLTLGQVFQDIAVDRSELDNVVDLFLRWSLASLPGVTAGVPTAHARLRHTFEVVAPNTVEITFTDTEVKLAGGLQGWLDSLPQFSVPRLPDFLQAPKGLRSARFDVVYLDEQLRITRGDRGELRVFLKGEV